MVAAEPPASVKGVKGALTALTYKQGGAPGEKPEEKKTGLFFDAGGENPGRENTGPALPRRALPSPAPERGRPDPRRRTLPGPRRARPQRAAAAPRMASATQESFSPASVVPYRGSDGIVVLCGVVVFDVKEGPVLRHAHPSIEELPDSIRVPFGTALREALPFAALPEGKYHAVEASGTLSAPPDGGGSVLRGWSGGSSLGDDGGAESSWTFLLHEHWSRSGCASESDRGRVLFCVSHFVSVASAGGRGCEQCAVVAVARAPVLQLLQARLRGVAGLCVVPQTRYAVAELYDSLNRTRMQDLGPSDLFSGVPLSRSVARIGGRALLRLLRLAMLEGRVLLVSRSPVVAANAALCLAALLPGELTFGIGAEGPLPLLAPLRYRWRRFGLPLRVFSSAMVLQPAAVMADVDFLRGAKGFLAATTNRMLCRIPLGLDALFDLDAGRFLAPEGRAPALGGSLRTLFGAGSSAEDPCAPPSAAAAAALRLPAELEGLARELDEACRSSQGNEEWRGSDGWVRQRLQAHFEGLLAEAAGLLDAEGLLAPEDWDQDSQGGRRPRPPVRVSFGAREDRRRRDARPDPQRGRDRARCLRRMRRFGEAWAARWAATRHVERWARTMQRDRSFWAERTGASPRETAAPPRRRRAGANGLTDETESETVGTGLAPAGNSAEAEASARDPPGSPARPTPLPAPNAPGASGTPNTPNTPNRSAPNAGPGPQGGDPSPAAPASILSSPLRMVRTSLLSAAGATSTGSVTYDNGDAYTGGLRAGKRHGHGEYVERATGHTYSGEWSAGLRHGHGVLSNADGSYCYDGEWDRDQRSGQGRLVLRGVLTYTGGFRDGAFHGAGRSCHHDGSVYDGEFRGGEKCGAGRLVAPAFEYVGEFLADERHGHGHAVYRDGSAYVGQWRAGAREGEGRWERHSALSFAPATPPAPEEKARAPPTAGPPGPAAAAAGEEEEEEEEEEDAPSATAGGVLRLHLSGAVLGAAAARDRRALAGRAGGDAPPYVASYEGAWLRGRWHGMGIASLSNGDSFEGRFGAGRPVGGGSWRVVWRSGDQYDGVCRFEGAGERRALLPGVPHGRGTLKYAGGDVYTGEFAAGERSGEGLCLFAAGDAFRGFWARDEPYAAAHSFSDIGLAEVSLEDRAPAGGGARRRRLEDLTVIDYGDAPGGGAFHGAVRLPCGDVYIGALLDGKMHGRGELVEHRSGHSYTGGWREGRRHGRGVLVSGDGGWLYEGDFFEGKRTGAGRCVLQGEETYEGAFLDGLYHGEGVLHRGDGTAYRGEFRAGAFDGAGRLSKPSGDTYVGEFRAGEPEGTGEMTYASGASYTGQWAKGRPSGEGLWKRRAAARAARAEAEGEKEKEKEKEKEWERERPAAEGEGAAAEERAALEACGGYVRAGARVEQYEGPWLEGRWHGIGQALLSDGRRLEGAFRVGRAVDGDWSIGYGADSPYHSYAGRAANGVPHGEGVMKYRNGDVYTGNFVHSVRSGHGVAVFANGERFDGFWEGDHIALDGEGTLTLADGTVHHYHKPEPGEVEKIATVGMRRDAPP